MTELHGPLITDPTSYESSEGDILPIADIIEPTGIVSEQPEVEEPSLDADLAHKLGGLGVSPEAHADPSTTYESSEGDILPAADVAEPDGLVAAEPFESNVANVAEKPTTARTPAEIYDEKRDALYDKLDSEGRNDNDTINLLIEKEIGLPPKED